MPELQKRPVEQDTLITAGMWGNVPWEFFASSQEPAAALCDAAFCIVTYRGKVVLAEHKTRGYEFTGGHVETGEDILKAVIREVREEGKAIVDDLRFFGYKKTSPSEPVPHSSDSGRFYPFPHSYIPYYTAEASGFVEEAALPEDISSVKLASYNEALQLLQPDQNHDKILGYLVTSGSIILE